MAQAESLRRSLYVLFARLFSGPPDEALYTRLRDGGLRDFARVQGIDLTSDLVDEEDAAGSVVELGAEYARLAQFVSLRASDYNGATEDPVVAISGYLAEHGLETDGDPDLPLDHLAYALGIMGEFAGQAEAGDPDADTRARAFFLRHINPWAPQALAEVSEKADRHFYRGLSAMLAAVLGSERSQYRA